MEVTLGRIGEISNPPKRGVIYALTRETLAEILRDRLPKDGEIVQAWWSLERGRLCVKVWSPSLPIVPEGYTYEIRELE